MKRSYVFFCLAIFLLGFKPFPFPRYIMDVLFNFYVSSADCMRESADNSMRPRR